MPNLDLNQQAAKVDLRVRAERSQQIAVLNAVHGFYLAKRFSIELAHINGWTNNVVAR